MKEKGTMTVEAALTLPLFILVLLFIINFLNIFYLQLVIQQGLTHVGNTVGEYFYGVSLLTDVDQFTMSESTGSKAAQLQESIGSVAGSASSTLEMMNDGVTLEKLPQLVENGTRLYRDVIAVKDSIGAIHVDDVKGYLFASGIDAASGGIVKVMMDQYIKEMNINTNLLDGEIKYHVFLLNEGENHDMVLMAVYTYKHSMFTIFFDKIPMRQAVRVHPWIGGSTKGIRGPG